MKLRLQQEVDPGNPNWEFIQMIRYVIIVDSLISVFVVKLWF